MAAGAVRVKGLKELTRDFRKISKDLTKELREELKEAAEPVAKAAESRALTEIRNMPRSPDWAETRVGVTARAVYIVPRQRGGRRSGRANLKGLLLTRAFDPALEDKRGEVLERVDRMLGRLAGEHGF